MTQNKESNFASAVAYLHNCEAQVQPFLARVTAELAAHFKQFEVILVNDASHDGSVQAVRDFIAAAPCAVPVTVVNMSLSQGLELCMNAGLDLAIGDFIFEFDTLSLAWDESLLFQAYQTALQGYDVVSVSPVKNRSAASGLFYKVFNACSGSRYQLQTDVFRVVSRRALNRVHAISPTLAYRKAAYAASGLRVYTLTHKSVRAEAAGGAPRLSLAVDSLALYTSAAYRFSCGVAGLMALGTLAELLYTLCVYLGGAKPIEGWTTTMFVLTVGFFGVFLILAIVLKYLSLLVELVFKNQKYLVESVEKLQK